jgi:apolipoprotein N-acyltransferase
MVKADGGYDSAIVDPRGRVRALAVHPEGGEATVLADVPLGRGPSLAARLGDWLGWLCLAGMVFFMVGERWLIKRAEA